MLYGGGKRHIFEGKFIFKCVETQIFLNCHIFPLKKKYFFLCCADPYVKIWLLFGEKRVDKKKTPVYKCNLNPTFNQVHCKKIFSFLFIGIGGCVLGLDS
jgi:hypothetical protein